MKSSLWMHQSFTLWLTKRGYYHSHLLSRQSKNPKVQLLHQNPVTLLPQKPWLQDAAAANFTEGTRLKGAAFSGLSVLTIYTSKGIRRETTVSPVSSECHRGWQVLGSLSFQWREGKVFTESMCISLREGEYHLSALSQNLAQMQRFPFHHYSALCSLSGVSHVQHSRDTSALRPQTVAARLLLHQQQENYKGSVLACYHLQSQAAPEQKGKKKRTFSMDN